MTAERSAARLRWLRFNREHGEFELKCVSCSQWLGLDPTLWDEARSLSTCRMCMNERRRQRTYPCGHPRIEVNTIRNRKGYGLCRSCQNERNRLWARNRRAELKNAA